MDLFQHNRTSIYFASWYNNNTNTASTTTKFLIAIMCMYRPIPMYRHVASLVCWAACCAPVRATRYCTAAVVKYGSDSIAE
eukprot:5691745-Pleurochrysis_carterae.AAC.1